MHLFHHIAGDSPKLSYMDKQLVLVNEVFAKQAPRSDFDNKIEKCNKECYPCTLLTSRLSVLSGFSVVEVFFGGM